MFPRLTLALLVGGQALLGNRRNSLAVSAEAVVKQPHWKYHGKVVLNMQKDEHLENVCPWRTATWTVFCDVFTGSLRESASRHFVCRQCECGMLWHLEGEPNILYQCKNRARIPFFF